MVLSISSHRMRVIVCGILTWLLVNYTEWLFPTLRDGSVLEHAASLPPLLSSDVRRAASSSSSAAEHSEPPQNPSPRPCDKGPYWDWKVADETRRALLEYDVQEVLGFPKSPMYAALRRQCLLQPHDLDFPFVRHLAPPPARCARYYDDLSPIRMDCALARMMGPDPRKITIEEARNGTHGYLRQHLTGYILRDGVLYYDRRTSNPLDCRMKTKIIGILAFFAQTILRLGPLPDVAFLWTCVDNPLDDATWSYNSIKDTRFRTLAFPNEAFMADRWTKVSNHEREPPLCEKPKHGEWRGGRNGPKPMIHLGRPGYSRQEPMADLSVLWQQTCREYFVKRYGSGSHGGIFASFQKVPWARLLAENRVLFSIAGVSATSNSLELLASNSIVVMQDFAAMAWQETFFDPGLHYIEIPRSMPHLAVVKALDHVNNDDNLALYTNMTRLATTVAEIVANDLDFAACFMHRAMDLWRWLMEDVPASTVLDAHAVPLLNLTQHAKASPEKLLEMVLEAAAETRETAPSF